MPPEERLDMSRTKKQATEAAVREIRRRTRRKFAPEEKIRIVLEGLRGEESISELCRREGIAANRDKPVSWRSASDQAARSSSFTSWAALPSRNFVPSSSC